MKETFICTDWQIIWIDDFFVLSVMACWARFHYRTMHYLCKTPNRFYFSGGSKKLYGHVPDGMLKNFDNVNYVGNEGLYGSNSLLI